MVQSKIATFKKVSDESARMAGTFDRATEAAFDLAAGGFGEASSNAVMLGKALQNPALGAAALSKAGALNKADIPLIKQIQATKGLGAAQEFVLKAVERQVKGQAANTATSAAKMKVTFSEVSETLGKSLLPQVQKVMGSVGTAVNKFNAWAQNNGELLGTIVKVVGGLGVLSLGVSAASFVFGGLFKTIAFGKQMLLAFRTAQMAYTAAQVAGTGVTGGMTAAVTALNLAFLANPITWVVIGVMALIGVGYLLIKNWDKVKAFFVGLWASIKGVFSKALNWFKEWGVLFLGPIGFLIKGWQMVPDKFKNIGKDILMGLWEGIKSKATALFSFVKDVGKSVATAFKTVLGIASPSKVFMDYGVNITEGASKGIQKGQSKLSGVSAGMGKSITPVGGSSKSGGGSSVSVTFSPVINGGSGGDISSQMKAMIPELIRQIEDSLARKQRLAY
jgi:phage-related minor tail protein